MSDKLKSLQEDVRSSLKSKDTTTYNTLKYLLSKMDNAQIESRGQGRQFGDQDFDRVVLKELKAHQESVEAYKKGGRDDLVKKEQEEVAVLKKYAPQMLGEGEVEAVVAKKIAALQDSGEVNFGKLMGEVMKELKGRADGETVKAVVQRNLGK